MSEIRFASREHESFYYRMLGMCKQEDSYHRACSKVHRSPMNMIIWFLYNFPKEAFSEDKKVAIAEARKKLIVYDEDCPEITPERTLKFGRVNPPGSRIENLCVKFFSVNFCNLFNV